MATMQLKNIFGEVLWEGEANSARDAFDKAIHWCTNLHGADMHGMNLRDADMRRANLCGADLSRAILNGADLSDANLCGAILNGADLSDANLSDANLSDANLSDANLCGANLSDANLTGIRDDFEIVLKAAHAEAPALLAALREGRVDGTQYAGSCACLIGTIARARDESYNKMSTDLRPNSSRPAEKWFLSIRNGDTPASNQVSAITVEWVEQWLVGRGQGVPPHAVLHWRGDAARLAKDLVAAGVDVAVLRKALAHDA